MTELRRSILAASIALALAPAYAAPPAGTPYHTDSQESYVWDQTADVIGTVNMITCIVDAINADELVNQGNYAALVNENACKNDRANASQASAGSATTGAASYMRGVINASRASNADPMRARVWFEDSYTPGATIFVNVSAAGGPSQTNPYGQFRLDYCGTDQVNGACQMQGMLSGAADGLRFVETEQGGRDTQLYLTRAGESGAGALRVAENGQPPQTFQFAFGPTHFLRSNVMGAACFDRRLSEAQSSVWRYGLYDAAGARVERNSGFPIKFSEGGQTWYGFAGYFGVNLPSDALAALDNGDTVVRQQFAQGAADISYRVMKAKGRLVKHTRRTATLGEMSGVTFSFRPWAGLSNTTANAIKSGEDGNSIRNFDLDTFYDSASTSFKVSGYRSCSPSGCTSTALPAAVTLSSTDLTGYATGPGLQAYAQSFGGNLHIPAATVAAPADNAVVSYRTQDLVYPGASDAPTSLACVNNCPTAATLAAYFGNSNPTPYGATANAWGPSSTTVAYSVNSSTGQLEAGGGAAVIPGNVTADNLESTPYRWGIRSGRLVSNLNDLACDGAPGQFCEQKADDLAVFYTWETGPRSWNQFVGLRDLGTGAFLRFDPPLQVTFNVPNNPTLYGRYAGSSVRLDYSGFGELGGIPGHCVSAATNQPVDCGAGGNNVRWVPAFSIPFDATSGVVTAGSNTYYAKWLNREVRFRRETGMLPAACSALATQLGSLASLPPLSEPANPASSSDARFIGPKPSVTGAPRVVHGVTMY